MGWWQINSADRGQIAQMHGSEGAKDEADEPLYGGDGPADLMGMALDQILFLCGKGSRPRKAFTAVEGISRKEIKDLVLRRVMSPNFLPAKEEELFAVVDAVWAGINKQWQREWQRDPKPEEREGIVSFTCSCFRE